MAPTKSPKMVESGGRIWPAAKAARRIMMVRMSVCMANKKTALNPVAGRGLVNSVCLWVFLLRSGNAAFFRDYL